MREFPQNCAAIDIKRENNEKKPLNTLTHCIEQVSYATNLNIITPFVFNRNLVMFSVTISEELVTMNKKWKGCCSSRNVSNLICEPVPPIDRLKEHQFIMIDNNQKIGTHSGRIREGFKVRLSIVDLSEIWLGDCLRCKLQDDQ